MAETPREQLGGIRGEASDLIGALKDAKTAINELSSTDLGGIAAGFDNAVKLAKDLQKLTEGQLFSQQKINSLKTQTNQLEGQLEIITKKRRESEDKSKEVLKNITNLEDQLATKLKAGQTIRNKDVQNLVTQINNQKSLVREEEARLNALATAEDLAGKLREETERTLKLQAQLNSQTKFFDTLERVVTSIPVLGPALAGPFQKASAAAKEAALEGGGKFNTFLKGSIGLAKGLAEMLGPAAVLAAVIKASDQTSQLNKQLGLGQESAGKVRERFAEIAQESGSSRFNTEKMIAANAALNQQLGTSVEFSGDMLKDFTQLTEYMGLSAEAAGKIANLGKITGQTSKEFAGNIALSVSQANKANGVFVSTTTALEKIKNLSGTTLLNLQRNPKAIGEAIVATEKLGMSFQQLRTTADSLLNFEQSISNELEAEVLTGRQLNLERARAAALRGDDVALAKELASQVGNVAQFEKMNVIQRQSLAQAFGMSADQMADMLMKQELMNKLGKEANNLTDEQSRKIREMVEANPGMTPQQALIELQSQESAAKKFQDAVAKLRTVFTDIVAFLSPYVEKFGSFVSSIASSGLAKVLMGSGIILSLGAALKNMVMPRGSSPGNPIYTAAATGGAIGGTGMGMGFTSGQRANMVRQTGSAGAARTALMRNRGMGLGAVAGLAGGLMMQSENEGMQIGGAALSGAGTGAMIGSMFMPGIGTAVGAGLGAAIGGLTAFLEKKDADEAKSKSTQETQYEEMIKLMRMQAEREVDIYMDSNKVGQQIVVGGYQVNNKINHN